MSVVRFHGKARFGRSRADCQRFSYETCVTRLTDKRDNRTQLSVSFGGAHVEAYMLLLRKDSPRFSFD
jgi:hypothetical protein